MDRAAGLALCVARKGHKMKCPIVAGEVVSTLPQLIEDAAGLKVDGEHFFNADDIGELRFLAEILRTARINDAVKLLRVLDRA